MGKLHKKMVALGDMTQYSYDDIVEKCGEPRDTRACSFTDIGEGTRATWSDGIFSITFNFDENGRYCGIYDHKNWAPYIWLSVITAVLMIAAFLFGAHMRRKNADNAMDAAALTTAVLSAQTQWRSDRTAGATLLDLDFDGAPELLAVDTEFVDLSGSMYFADATEVRVFRVSPAGVQAAGGFTVPGYCFMAELTRRGSGDGSVWSFDENGLARPILLDGGVFSAGEGSAVSAVGESFPLLPNECWITAAGKTADHAAVEADLSAVAEAYFA